jgi:hypothetical protein
MSFVAPDTHARLGEVVGNGHCMVHVQTVAGVPHSSVLRRGNPAKGSGFPRGTIIATFDDDGLYANATDGSSHIAILLEQTDEGLKVVDQWVGQPVHERVIRFKGGQGQACDDADQFYIAETATQTEKA